MDITNELKKIIEKHPILSVIGLALWIWFGSWYLGNKVGEFIGNLSNQFL